MRLTQILLSLCLSLYLLFACKQKTPVEPEPQPDVPQWAMFRHDVRHTGNVNNDPYEGIVGPSGDTVSVKWAFDSGSNLAGSPAIDKDGTIYFAAARGGADSVFYAINADGTLKWKFSSLVDTWSSPAIGDDGTVYIIPRSRGAFAFNPDGSLKWNISIGGLAGAPAVGPDGTIYWCNSRHLNAINPDGTIKWQLGGGDKFHHPIVGLDGTIYYNYCDRGTLVAVNPDGSMKWEYADTSAGLTFDSAVLDGDGTVYFLSGGTLYALDNTGRLKWKIPRIGITGIISVPAIAPNHTVFVVGVQYLRAVSPDGEVKWKRAAEEISASPVVDADGNVYICHHDLLGLPEVITSYSIDGSLRWQLLESPRGTITGGTPLGPDGTLFFGFYSGRDHNFYAIH